MKGRVRKKSSNIRLKTNTLLGLQITWVSRKFTFRELAIRMWKDLTYLRLTDPLLKPTRRKVQLLSSRDHLLNFALRS